MGEYAAKYHATMAKGFEAQSECLSKKTNKVASALRSSGIKKSTKVKKSKKMMGSKATTSPKLNVGSVKNNSIREAQITQANIMLSSGSSLVTVYENFDEVAPELSKARELIDKQITILSEFCSTPRGFKRGGTFRRSKREADRFGKEEINQLRDNREFNGGEMKIDVISNGVNTIKKSDGRSEKFSIKSDNKISQLNASDFAKKTRGKV